MGTAGEEGARAGLLAKVALVTACRLHSGSEPNSTMQNDRLHAAPTNTKEPQEQRDGQEGRPR